LLLHPFFPHAHGDAHAAPVLTDLTSESADLAGAAAVDQAPGISAGTSNSGAHDAIAGLLLPLVIAAALLDAARRIAAVEARPEQRAVAPPIPPPRLVSSVA
jgi:hypothetical protein